MERINPPAIPAYMFRHGTLVSAPATLQELGIYSSLFIDVNTGAPELVKEHHTFGKLIRTKGADSDEGGVVAGFSVVDQPYLTEEIGNLRNGIQIKPLVANF